MAARNNPDGVTVRGLCDAVRADDLEGVRAMLVLRPELVHLDLAEDDEHRALHHAVLQQRPEMVRLLMQHGANPRKGIWPHRDATSPLTIATERGYADIVAIIRDEERRRSPASVAVTEAHSSLIHARDPQSGMTALHWASANLWDRLSAWLIDRGADVSARNTAGQTPLDLLGCECEFRSPVRSRFIAKVANLLLERGAERTVRWAIATGDAAWLRKRDLKAYLKNQRRLVT